MYENYELGKTLGEVGEMFGVSRARVQQIFKEYGFEKRKTTHSAKMKESRERRRRFISREVLESLYCEQKLPAARVGEILGVYASTVRAVLRRYGIPVRSQSEAAALINDEQKVYKQLTEDYLRHHYIVENKSVMTVAKEIGCSKALVTQILRRFGIKKITGEAYEKRYGKRV